jgi:hypothetical protein
MVESLSFLLGSGASAAFGLPTMGTLTDELKRESELAGNVTDLFSDWPIAPDCEAILSVIEMFCKGAQVAIDDFGPGMAAVARYLVEEKSEYREVLSMLSHAWPDRGAANRELEQLKLIMQDVCQADSRQENLAAIFYLKMLRQLQGQITLRGCKEVSTENLGVDMNTRKVPFSVFTTNYDLLVERVCENLKINCRRGTKGEGTTLTRELVHFVDLDSMAEYGDIKLYKLHGSLDFFLVGNHVERLPAPSRARTVSTGEELKGELMIYPLHSKYVYSYPYLPWFKKFYEQLCGSKVCLIVGHSMRDRGVNDIMTAALVSNPNLKLVFVNDVPDKIGILKESSPYIPQGIDSRSVIVPARFGEPGVIQRIIEALKREPGGTA